MVDTLKIRIPNVHLENISTDEQLKAFIKINDDWAVQDYNIISSVNLDNVPSNETKIFFNYNVNLNFLLYIRYRNNHNHSNYRKLFF